MPHPTVPPDHAAHDPLLVAAFAAGDATGRQLVEAAALVAGCHDCAALHHDLRTIAMALPATAATAPSPRPRDFRLTADQAAALRPSGWRRLLAPFAGPSFAFARPLGTGLATLGLAGILVAGASGIPLGGAASAPAEDMAAAPAAAGEASPGAEELYLYNAAATEAPAAGGGAPGSLPAPSPAGVGDDRADDGGATGAPSAAPDLEQPAPSDELLTAVGAPLATASEPGAAKEAEVLADGTQVPTTAIIAGSGLAALAAGLLLLILRSAARRLA